MSEYVAYLIPRTGNIIVGEDMDKHMDKFLSSHASDHLDMFVFTNSLLEALDKPLLRVPGNELLVNSREVSSFNNFLLRNNEQHKVIYSNINDLGSLAIPVFNVYPVNTNWLYIMRMEKRALSSFVTKENQVHMIMMRSLNLLAQALQYVP